jgi:glycosyltransferase involved in cell wall biosynthesis
VGAVLAREFELPLAVSNLGEIYSDRKFFEDHRDVVEYVVDSGSAFFSCSQHCANSYREIGLDPKAESIPYGIDIDNFVVDSDGVAARTRIGLEGDAPLVLYLGRMVRDMGLDTVLSAIPITLQAYPNAQFMIAGAPGELQPAAESLALRYPAKVTVRANLPHAQLPDVLSACSVLLAPTRGDRACSSLASAEAMAAGRAVIATRVGGIPEIVVDGETGILVEPDDAQALTRAIVAALGDPGRSRAMGAAGRTRVEAFWDENKTNAEYEARFRNLLSIRKHQSQLSGGIT